MNKILYWIFKKNNYLRNIAVKVDEELRANYTERQTKIEELYIHDADIYDDDEDWSSYWSAYWS